MALINSALGMALINSALGMALINSALGMALINSALGMALINSALGMAPIASAAEPSATEPSADERGLELFMGLRDVLVHRCAGCHGAGSTSHEGGLDLSTRDTLLAGGGRGPAVVPGRAAESLLYRLAAKLEEPHMPEEGDPLPADVLARLAEWIDRGAPYDRPLIEAGDRGPWTERMIDPRARRSWPFTPLAAVAVPTAADPDGWCRTPIDRFILARLREAGLAPAPMADRRTLRRRLAADLTGLPATPAEIRAFIDDQREDAVAEVVDDLLSRPTFGERQAQHWLDIARYAESFGYEQDYDRPHAHAYRDFVVSAFHDDLPFDTFLRWQIAGDELAPDIPAARIATGFLAAGAFPTQLTEKEFESARSGELDDIVSTIGTAMLGLTVGCARCHDHKFDPLPQADYYRLAATFTATVRSNAEIAIAPERHALAVAAWQAELDRAVAARRRIEEEELPARFDAWIAAWQPAEAGSAPDWRPGRIVAVTSRAGTPLTALADGSFLAAGAPANDDTYTFTLDFPSEPLVSLRIDALADPSLPRGGPGRVAHGNFALSNLTVAAAPIPAAGAEPVFSPVKLGAPRADFSQPGLDVSHAIDDSPTSGWAIDPHVGQSHVAIFDFAEPVGYPGGCRLMVTLDFRTSPHHAIGRPRIAAATVAGFAPIPVTPEADPVDRARSDAWLISHLVARSDRTAAESAELRRLQAGSDEGWRAADAFVRTSEGARPKPETVTALVAGDHLTPIPHHADGRGYPHAYPETWFLRRGDVRQREGVATAGFLQVLSRAPEETWRQGAGQESAGAGRRAALARWITDPEAGAGSLAARVIVNRIWQQYFGTGLVATPSDFGAQSDPPSHPELLEWLAGELVRGGWRLQPIHRLIVTSATYRQSSTAAPRALLEDPRNRLLSHFRRRRLDAEGVRDALLAISGALDPSLGGRAGPDDASPRRSLYLDVKRSRPSPFLRAFDAPDRVTGMGKRAVTTTAPQVLLLMNGPAVRRWAEAFAARVVAEPHRFRDEVSDETAPIDTAYALALGRAPTDDELAAAVAFLAGQTAAYAAAGQADPTATSLADFCQVLLGLNETLHVE